MPDVLDTRTLHLLSAADGPDRRPLHPEMLLERTSGTLGRELEGVDPVRPVAAATPRRRRHPLRSPTRAERTETEAEGEALAAVLGDGRAGRVTIA